MEWSQIWILRVLGESATADRIERIVLNGGPASLSRDGKLHTYYQAPNRQGGKTGGVKQAGGTDKFKELQSPLCCSGNVARVIPNFIIHMWMATYDNGLAATLYGPGEVTAKVGNGVVARIACETSYPFDDVLTFKVDLKGGAAEFPLYLRIPTWCAQPTLTINNQPASAKPDAKGFVQVRRAWKSGDVVSLKLPMPIIVEQGRETEGSPYATVSAGPLLYALGIPEKDENTPAGDDWKYALDFDASQPAAAMRIERKPMPARWDWPLASPVSITVPAQAIEWSPGTTYESALPDAPVSGKGNKQLSLIPYGCAKFRVWMFPVTPRAHQGK